MYVLFPSDLENFKLKGVGTFPPLTFFHTQLCWPNELHLNRIELRLTANVWCKYFIRTRVLYIWFVLRQWISIPEKFSSLQKRIFRGLIPYQQNKGVFPPLVSLPTTKKHRFHLQLQNNQCASKKSKLNCINKNLQKITE